MSKTNKYKLESSARRAAKRKLGKDAKVNVDFKINGSSDGMFTWEVISKKKQTTVSMRKATLQMMADGHDDESILSHIKSHYPNRKYDLSHVKWYRSYFANNEMLDPEFAPRRSKIYKDWVSSFNKNMI